MKAIIIYTYCLYLDIIHLMDFEDICYISIIIEVPRYYFSFSGYKHSMIMI